MQSQQEPSPFPPRVFHCKHIPKGIECVYVGRPTRWGNPFILDNVNDDVKRDCVIAQYETYLIGQPTLVADVRRTLRGKHLSCWCFPKPCHADVLLRIANQ